MRPSHVLTEMTLRLRLLRAAGIAAVLLTFAPSIARAQVAARAAGDVPSTNREARMQSDSLTVHFLRQPHAKPAARIAASLTPAEQRKFAGRPTPLVRSAAPAPVVTPLPTRARTTKP